MSHTQVSSRNRWNSDCIISVPRILRTGSSVIVGFPSLSCRSTTRRRLLSAFVTFRLAFWDDVDSVVKRPSTSFSIVLEQTCFSCVGEGTTLEVASREKEEETLAY